MCFSSNFWRWTSNMKNHSLESGCHSLVERHLRYQPQPPLCSIVSVIVSGLCCCQTFFDIISDPCNGKACLCAVHHIQIHNVFSSWPSIERRRFELEDISSKTICFHWLHQTNSKHEVLWQECHFQEPKPWESLGGSSTNIDNTCSTCTCTCTFLSIQNMQCWWNNYGKDNVLVLIFGISKAYLRLPSALAPCETPLLSSRGLKCMSKQWFKRSLRDIWRVMRRWHAARRTTNKGVVYILSLNGTFF